MKLKYWTLLLPALAGLHSACGSKTPVTPESNLESFQSLSLNYKKCKSEAVANGQVLLAIAKTSGTDDLPNSQRAQYFFDAFVSNKNGIFSSTHYEDNNVKVCFLNKTADNSDDASAVMAEEGLQGLLWSVQDGTTVSFSFAVANPEYSFVLDESLAFPVSQLQGLHPEKSTAQYSVNALLSSGASILLAAPETADEPTKKRLKPFGRSMLTTLKYSLDTIKIGNPNVDALAYTAWAMGSLAAYDLGFLDCDTPGSEDCKLAAWFPIKASELTPSENGFFAYHAALAWGDFLGNTPKAKQIFERIASFGNFNDSWVQAAHFVLGELALKEKNYGEAKKYFTAIISPQDDSVEKDLIQTLDSYCEMIRIFVENDKNKEAAVDYASKLQVMLTNLDESDLYLKDLIVKYFFTEWSAASPENTVTIEELKVILEL